MNTQTQAWFTIKDRPKGIPYPGAAEYEEESTHYPFKPLKGRPDDAAAIFEVQDDDVLRDVLIAFNDESTGVFTVGCEKSFNYEEEHGHWAKGYVEVAINDKGLVGDAQHYFKLFFLFNKFMREQTVDEPVGFHWELEPAHFLDAEIGGLTISVWVIVRPQEAPEMVREIWAKALSLLTAVVCGGPPRPNAELIYATPPAEVGST